MSCTRRYYEWHHNIIVQIITTNDFILLKYNVHDTMEYDIIPFQRCDM